MVNIQVEMAELKKIFQVDSGFLDSGHLILVLVAASNS